MTLERRYLVVLAVSVLLLAGCAPTAAEPTEKAADQPAASEAAAGTGAKGPKCEDNTSDVELFSDPAVSSAPEYGQIWGDGSAFEISYDSFVEGQLGYEISYVQDNGGLIPVTGGFFPEPVGTTFSSSDLYFDSTSEGYYGIVSVDLTSNVQFDGTNYTADTVKVGNYCVILATSE